MMLYSDDAVIAMIAGKAYCHNSLPTGRVPNSSVDFLLFILYCYESFAKVSIFVEFWSLPYLNNNE